VSVEGFAQQDGSFGAEVTRRWVAALLRRGGTIGSILGGLVGIGDLLITAGTGMEAKVAAGECFVPGTSSASQSGYYLRNTASLGLAIAVSSETLPRIDRISAIVTDKSYSGGTDTFTIAVETGTPTSSATLANLLGVAAAPASSLTLGYILIPAKATSVENGNIANVATLCVPGLQSATYREGTAAERPAAGVKGRIWHATDTLFYSVDTGSAWLEITPPSSNKYAAAKAVTKAEAEAGIEPSATRMAYVRFNAETTKALEVGGVSLGDILNQATILVPPGQKWKATTATNVNVLLL
jgi:hypothetical protein